MNVVAVSRFLGVLLCAVTVACAQVSKQMIVVPNDFYFTDPVYEVDGMATNATIQVKMNPGNPLWAGVVGFATRDGSAVAGQDYVAVTGRVGVSGPAGGSFNVPLLPSGSSTEKTVLLSLVDPTGGDTVSRGQAVLVIHGVLPPIVPPTFPLASATFKWTAFTEGQAWIQASARTNQTAAATNIARVSKATMNSAAFNSADMLALLSNSFNTAFPGGARIALGSGHLYVVDSTGTNILLDPGNVVSLEFRETFVSGLETELTTQDRNGIRSSGNTTESITARVVLSYNDEKMPTADGTSTRLEFSGLWVMKTSTNLKNLLSKVSITFQGTGSGTIRNNPTILTGTVTASGAGATNSP